MMSLEQIQYENEKATRQHRRPYRFFGNPDNISNIPYVGSYVHNDWERVDPEKLLGHGPHGMADRGGMAAYFVDASGFGADYEPALTFEAFKDLLVEGMGYGIIEAGQFQVIIGLFRRKSDA